MNNLFKALTIAAGAIFTIGVIILAFTFFNKGKDAADSAQKQVIDLTDSIKVSDKEMYDNTEVTGADVLTALNHFKNDKVCIQVATVHDATPENYFYQADLVSAGTTNLTDCRTVGNSKYINRNDKYMATLILNATNDIVGVKFNKK